MSLAASAYIALGVTLSYVNRRVKRRWRTRDSHSTMLPSGTLSSPADEPVSDYSRDIMATVILPGGLLRNTDRMRSAVVSMRRREFLKSVCAASAGASLAMRKVRAEFSNYGERRKVVIVTFGGGARDTETFAIEGQRNIPHLLGELIPQGTFFTQVVNRGILGHYVATASIATGVYETFNNFVANPPPNPTLFEYYGRSLRRADAWVIAPSNGFQQIGSSSHKEYGPAFGATVIQPKQILTVATGSKTNSLLDYQHLLQDSYESPVQRGRLTERESDFNQHLLASILKLSVDDFVRHALTLNSPDELSVFIARELMRKLAPSLLLMTLHDIDVAHAGAYSLYLDGIQRADRLCAQIWSFIQDDPEYKNRTTLLILPDFGRDADGDPGGNGFQHHRTGGPLARTTWLLAPGPGIRQNVTVDRPIEPIDVVPTVGGLLGFDTPIVRGRSIPELL